MRRRLLTPIVLTLSLLPAACRADDETSTMAQGHQHDTPAATAAATTPPAQPVTGEEVVYANVGGKPVRGYLAKPKSAQGSLPALIVIHEWWGLNDNIRQMTDRLAGEGYAALAVDLYDGKTATDPQQAQKLMQPVVANTAPGEENLRQAYNYLETQQKAPKIGVIGWCFGGGWSLGTAMLLPDKIDATVIYYGFVETDKAKLEKLQMPIVGFFGKEDKAIPIATALGFQKALQELGKQAEVYIYDDADHAFANPSGGNYNAEAAQDSWQKTMAFLAKNLKGGTT